MIAEAKLKTIVLAPAIIIITPSLDMTGRGDRKDGKERKEEKTMAYLVYH